MGVGRYRVAGSVEKPDHTVIDLGARFNPFTGTGTFLIADASDFQFDQPGDYTVTLIADREPGSESDLWGMIPESNERNNSKTVIIHVAPPMLYAYSDMIHFVSKNGDPAPFNQAEVGDDIVVQMSIGNPPEAGPVNDVTGVIYIGLGFDRIELGTFEVAHVGSGEQVALDIARIPTYRIRPLRCRAGSSCGRSPSLLRGSTCSRSKSTAAIPSTPRHWTTLPPSRCWSDIFPIHWSTSRSTTSRLPKAIAARRRSPSQ